MAIELYQFMSEQSVATLVNHLLTKTNIRVGERIVQSIDANSSDKQYLSALALYNLLQTLDSADAELLSHVNINDNILKDNAQTISSLNDKQSEQDSKLSDAETGLTDISTLVGTFKHLTIETVEGPISNVTNPQPYILYLQRDDQNDTTWKMYIYHEYQNPEYVEYDPSKYFTTDGAGTITGLTADGLAASELIIPKEINGVTITSIADNAFDTASVTNVKFMGTEDEWGNITIGTTGNDALVNATKEYDYVLPAEYLYSWVDVGDTALDLSVIWSKDEIEELKEALNIHYVEPLPDPDIFQVVDDAFNNNVVDYRMDPEGNPVVPDEIEHGVALSTVPITGTMVYDGVEVPGTFSWDTTDQEFADAVANAPEET